MKKLLVMALAVALTVVFAMPASATKSRVTALGFVDNYIEDDYNIFAWPASLPSYSNLVVLELHNMDFDGDGFMRGSNGYYGNDVWGTFGVTYGLGEDNNMGTLGMFFMEHSPGLNPNTEEIWTDASIFSWPIYNKFAVMYGYALEGMSFGVFFSRGDEGDTEELNGDEQEYHIAYTTIGVGARFDVGDAMYADVAFDYNMASLTNTYEVDDWGEITEDANSMMGFRGRVFYELDEIITLVPYFGFNILDFSAKADSTDFNTGCWGFKAMQFKFGIGANVNVNEDNMLLFAIEPYSLLKGEPSECEDDMTIEGKEIIMPNFLLALESDVKDWLTFRIGCMKSLVKFEYTTTDADNEYTETDTEAPFEWFMGLGFHIADFDIDCVINKEVPFTMGYWLTGYHPSSGGETPIGMISATYHF